MNKLKFKKIMIPLTALVTFSLPNLFTQSEAEYPINPEHCK